MKNCINYVVEYMRVGQNNYVVAQRTMCPRTKDFNSDHDIVASTPHNTPESSRKRRLTNVSFDVATVAEDGATALLYPSTVSLSCAPVAHAWNSERGHPNVG